MWFWNYEALARNDSKTQTESAPKTRFLRKIEKPEVLRVSSKRGELVARALQTIGHKKTICLQNEIFKRVNKMTIFGGSIKHGEHELFQTSKEPFLPENRIEIEEENVVNLSCSPILHLGHVQKNAADITASFGIQQSNCHRFIESTASNEMILMHTEDIVKVLKRPTARLDTDTGGHCSMV